MRKFVSTLMLGVSLLAVSVRADVAEIPLEPEVKQPGIAEMAAPQAESDFDRILSGEETLPLIDKEELADDVTHWVRETQSWFHKQSGSLLTFLIVSGISVFAGMGLALFARHLAMRGSQRKHRLRWQFVAALSGPVILMLVSGVVFLFLLPILHSLPTLYPMEARLFFTWLTLLAAWAGFQLIALLDLRMREFASRPGNDLDSLIVDIVRKVLKVTLLAATILFIGQSIFQLNITTLLAGAGVAGLAIAFASRETLANFFGTLVIVLDRPFRIGDRIQAGEINGIVLSVGMRSTRVQTAEESICTIPNNHIAEIPIENISSRGVIRYRFTLGLVYGTTAGQLELAIKLLHELLDDFKAPDCEEYRPRIFFQGLGASALNLEVIMWFKATGFDEEEQLRTEVNLEIVRRFTANQLEFAFNTVTNNLSGSLQLLPPLEK